MKVLKEVLIFILVILIGTVIWIGGTFAMTAIVEANKSDHTTHNVTDRDRVDVVQRFWVKPDTNYINQLTKYYEETNAIWNIPNDSTQYLTLRYTCYK